MNGNLVQFKGHFSSLFLLPTSHSPGLKKEKNISGWHRVRSETTDKIKLTRRENMGDTCTHIFELNAQTSVIQFAVIVLYYNNDRNGKWVICWMYVLIMLYTVFSQKARMEDACKIHVWYFIVFSFSFLKSNVPIAGIFPQPSNILCFRLDPHKASEPENDVYIWKWCVHMIEAFLTLKIHVFNACLKFITMNSPIYR